MAKRKTNEEFLIEVHDLVGDEYTFLDNYIDNKTKIRCRHNICKYEYEVTSDNFIRAGRRCPNCFGTPRKSNEEFLIEVHNLVVDEYTFLEEYKTNRIKIKCKHNICGHEYTVTPDCFIRGTRCPNCFGTPKKSNKTFIKEVYELVGDEYTFLEEYKTNKTKIKCRHNVCKHEYSVTSNDFIRGRRCPNCFGTTIKSNEEFIKEVYELVGDEYTFLEEYRTNNKTKIKIIHNRCNYKYLVKPNDFLLGYRCPKCNKSKGETKIAKYLDKIDIVYEEQVTFKGCKNKRPLKFDFKIYVDDTNFFLLEYHGIQHYRPVTFHNTNKILNEKEFKLTQLRDNIKEQYCLDNDIILYVLSYMCYDKLEETIDEVLTEYLTFI